MWTKSKMQNDNPRQVYGPVVTVWTLPGKYLAKCPGEEKLINLSIFRYFLTVLYKQIFRNFSRFECTNLARKDGYFHCLV